MEAKLLDGKKLAKKILKNLKEEIKSLEKKPKLVLLQVGNDLASSIYVKRKFLTSKKIGLDCELIQLDENTKQKDLDELILKLNKDNLVDGIMVQLPLPAHLDSFRIQSLIDPIKDVDGFGPVNTGNLFLGKPKILPATPFGIIKLLEEYKLNLEGKTALVIGRSNIVGKPLALLLLEKNATVIIAHSKTSNLFQLTKLADFLFVAVGKPRFIDGTKIKEGAIVVDIGINKIIENGQKKIVGDVDFESAKKVASFISPVPGGVGPLTVACLLANTLLAYKIKHKLIK
ncbi:MAG: bifunctional 5,10-methylenetetrahydrofolate dehydrogenase/5,10-methenyltetrahydrofolate cyclohydrolase [Candidatus Anstonellaceae archaeon]